VGEQLNIAKVVLEKSVDTLIDKAEDCFDRAKAGHEQADKQHEIAEVQHQNADKVEASADHLVTLGKALVADAVELKGEMEIVAAQNSHRPAAKGIPLESGLLTAPKIKQ
jgi:hypothetical protein